MRFLSVDEYLDRAGSQVVPKIKSGPNAGQVDVARILAAIEDACGTVRAYLAKDLLAPDGEDAAREAIPKRILEALPGIVFQLARFQLADGSTGSESVIVKGYNAAMDTLETLRDEPDRATVAAAIVGGPGTWIAGEAAAGDDV